MSQIADLIAAAQADLQQTTISGRQWLLRGAGPGKWRDGMAKLDQAKALADAEHPPDPPPPAPVSQPFGIATGWEPFYMGDADLARYLDLVKGLGATHVRTDINFAQVFEELNIALPYWGAADRYLAACQARGLEVVWLLANTPPVWAAVGYSGPWAPWADNNRFGEACGRTVDRYLPRGCKVFEVWNEPNYMHFFGDQHHRGYTDADIVKMAGMLKAAYAAMRRTGVTVIALGLAQAGTYAQVGGNGWMNDQRYLEKAYQLGGIKGHFDALGYHPYGDFHDGATAARYFDYAGPSDDWVGWNKLADTNPSIRSIMLANGDDKPIWATEVGAPGSSQPYTAGKGTTEAHQAGIADVILGKWRSRPYAGGLFWYTLRDSGTESTEHNRFGVVRHDWTRKPAYDTLKV